MEEIEIVCPVCAKRARTTVQALRGIKDHYPTVVLELDAYEAANLLHHMRRVWAGYYNVEGGGDWQGQVPIKLMDAMRRAGPEFTEQAHPNAGGTFPYDPPEDRRT